MFLFPSRTILIRDVATRESTRGMTFAASTAPSLLLHPPFVSPLNYLRVLRDWPTNPVRLNNLPIIRGPLCFICRVSNKSHCVFRRAASNSIRVRTRILSAHPASKKGEAKKRKRKRPKRSRRGRSHTIRTNWLEIRLNIANLWRSREGEQYPPSSITHEFASIANAKLSLILDVVYNSMLNISNESSRDQKLERRELF